MNNLFDAVPPQNLEAERAVLACCLQSSDAVREAADTLAGEQDFYAERHRLLYGVVVELSQRRAPIDRATVTARAEERGLLGKGLDAEFIRQLAGADVRWSSAGHYAGIVAEKARVRRSQERLRELADACYDPDVSLEQVAMQAMQAVEDAPGRFDDVKLLGDVAVDRVAALRRRKRGEIAGRTTGFRQLDAATGGLEDGKLILLAARPSMGKTGLVLDIAKRSSKSTGPPWLYVAKDDSVEALADRAVISDAMVSGAAYRLNLLPESQWDKLAQKAEELQTVPVFATDRCNNVEDIRKRVRRLQRQYQQVGGLVVDYLQLLADDHKTHGNRREEVSGISRGLKRLAVDLKIPVVALSQLSRAVENRDDKRPRLSDLYESGQLEADAEVVAFLFREEYYLEREGRDVPADVRGKVEIILAKQKNMPPCTVTMKFNREWVKFTEFDWEAGDGT